MGLKFVVYNAEDRIDRFLSSLFFTGRRKFVDLIRSNRVKVNGKNINKSYIVKHGDEIFIDFVKYEKYDYSHIKILFEDNNVAAIYKPPNFHSARLMNSVYSVEDYLLQLNGDFKLLNRLDYITGGILLASKNSEFFNYYKNCEKRLNVRKEYICFLKGKLREEKRINLEINQSKRKKVKVKSNYSDSSKTVFTPLALFENFTLTNVSIFKGARHQIRAHAAESGYPLIGDPLYGEKSDFFNHNHFFLLCYGYFFNEKYKEKKYVINFLPEFGSIIKEHLIFLEKNMEFLA